MYEQKPGISIHRENKFATVENVCLLWFTYRVVVETSSLISVSQHKFEYPPCFPHQVG